MNNRLIKKTLLYFIGNFSTKILSSILVPIYAFYITASDLGKFDYTQTIGNIIVPIFLISIWEAILKFTLTNEDEEKREKIVGTSAIFTIVMTIFMSLCIYIYYYIFAKDMQYIIYIILMICISGLVNVWQYYARGMNNNRNYVISSVIGTSINFILNIILICVLKMQLEALYISYIVSNFVLILIIEYKNKILSNIKKENIDLKILKKMIIFSAPLVINAISRMDNNKYRKSSN